MLAGAVVLLVVPFVVALVVLHDPRWYPALELAQTELHVRDVGTGHTPLTGLVGRLGSPGQRGSHPGPLAFFALAPVYRLAGSSPWALQMATVVLHLSAIAVALWIAYRRAGMRLLLLTAAVLTTLLRFYGPSLLTEPWNPYLPMLWWVVFLLAVWSVLEDDLALLPVAVVSGSLCAQTHISYLGLVGGLGAVAAATVAVRHFRRRRRGSAPGRTWTWVALATAVGAVLWLPPVLDEMKHDPGNLSVLADYFASSTEDPIGLRRAAELLVANLDPWRLLFGHAEGKVVTDPPPWSTGGLLFLGAWTAAIVVAWRLRLQLLLRLHTVLGVALAFGAVSLSRVYGYPWAWLVQWVWGLTALLAVVVAWTFGCAARQRLTGSRARVRLRAGAIIGLAVVALGSTIASAGTAARVEPDDVTSSRALRRLAPATVRYLEGRSGPSRGGHGRYLVAVTDPVGVIGALQAFGLVNELDREGIEVGIERHEKLRAAPYLTMDRARATAVLRVVTGPAIEVWKEKTGSRLIARYDPRTSGQRALQERLRREIEAELRTLGLAELIAQLENSFLVSFVFDRDPRIPKDLTAKMSRSLELGAPSAVFLEE